MNQSKLSSLLIFFLILIYGCSSLPDQPWPAAVPDKTSFVIIPAKDATLNSVLSSSYTPFLDDITSSAIPLLSRIDSTATSPITLDAITLYPGSGDRLQTVWITQTSNNFLKKLEENFYQKFAQNEYYFGNIIIHKLSLQQRTLFAAQLKNNLLLSESSLAIEEAIRAYTGDVPRAKLDSLSLSPGRIVMNTPSLDRWARQLTKVGYRPLLKKALDGTKPTLLSINTEGEKQNIQFSGTLPLNKNIPSDIVAAFSSENAPISLDKYISSNVAAFGLFRMAPQTAAPRSLADTTKLDSLFLTNNQRYSNIANTLSSEFALLTYAKSGFLTTGEHVFVRKTKDASTLRKRLRELANAGHIQPREGTYFVQSRALSNMIGSPLCGFQSFYLDVTGEGVIISKRKGLVEMISSDRNRRRTMYYEQSFREIKNDLPQRISGLFVTSEDFYPFIEPFLAPDNYVDVITSKFDRMAASAKLDSSQKNLDFNLKTFQTEDRNAPYREKWLFPTGSDISGKPVLADIGGSEQKEIIFVTKAGKLYALAADGTVVMQGNTGSDEPIGSPTVYDWYSTNQNVILVTAGNKVYGWNDNGQPLPKFPFQLSEKITAPLVVNDIDKDGLPNALVATANRKLHALNGRGEDISGWPVTTNAKIIHTPAVEEIPGGTSVLANSQNGLYAWSADGSLRKNFPKFINASLNGSPAIYNNNILGNAADGNLYAIGPKKLFADSLNVLETASDSSNIEAVYTSGSPLLGTPSVHNLTVNTEEQQYREPMILTMSSNGSVFLLNTQGQLRFTQNMGQPAASSFSPFITDIDSNNKDDLVALANFGRLYVWEVQSGKRIYSVPTSGMQHPIIADIDGDGYKELMAQTREGLRCWTIFGSENSDQ
ncbi:hypothetical protein LX73_2493 [Fodinibius salinus]|uniref:Repeat domain-containing protein n=1 Tax=Fodinibius salinus TaxID=860790 RepID=A0A5D3YHE5_9BACT|nr:VCBS repeat-containing protein [Fodinibius salinus]TYP91669.1 hypothetical protein LX73_2493 [Fodinibius salinus]